MNNNIRTVQSESSTFAQLAQSAIQNIDTIKKPDFLSWFLFMYYIRNISWKLSTNEIWKILSSEKIFPQYEVVMGSSWGKSFFWKKNLNQKQQKKPANSAASSQKPLRYQGRRNVKTFGGISQLVGHNLPTPTPWLEKGEFG